MNRRRRFDTAFGCGLIALCLSLLATEIILYSVNTLERHPMWGSGKRLLAERVMGSDVAMTTRNVLHRNRLDLHAWHGFNEFLVDEVFSPGRIRFRFSLGEEGYLAAIFNKTREGFSAIRLSRNPRFPSAFVRGTPEGGFVHREALPDLELGRGWHAGELRFDAEAVALRIDGRDLARFAEPPRPRQVVGFRSGHGRAWVDDVRIDDTRGHLVLSESFRNHRSFLGLWLIVLPVCVSLVAAPFLLALALGRDPAAWRLHVLMGGLSATFVLAVFLCFDYFFWSAYYPFKGYTPWGRNPSGPPGFEEARQSLFRALSPIDATLETRLRPAREFLAPEDGARRGSDIKVVRSVGGVESTHHIERSQRSVRDFLARYDAGPGLRILFLGSSQTWGSGALRPTDAIVHQVHRALAGALPPSTSYWSIDASVKASRSKHLLAQHRAYLHRFQPGLVVVNLSNNDRTDGFADRLRELLEFNESLGALSLFVLEANTAEHDPPWLEKKHRIMSDVAREASVPCIDLHGHLAGDAVYDSGMLWWDIVHMTSYAQRLAAEFIARGIAENFELSAGGRVGLRGGSVAQCRLE